jgi:CRP-like cAMP-binding protein
MSFSDMTTHLQELLKQKYHVRKMIKGTFLFQEGMAANEVFIIQSGKVQVSKIVADGRELTLRMCTSGDIVGELPLFSPTIPYMLNAKVIETGEVAVIHKDNLEAEIEKNPALAHEYMKWMSNQYRKTQTKFRDLILHGKKGALFSTLIRLSNSYGEGSDRDILITQPLTNQELANFCGTSREVVNRLLSELRKNNIISIDKGLITIHDLDYLKREIDCENCPIEICNID